MPLGYNRESGSRFPSQEKEITTMYKATQFPLALSWVCTVHKVQGLSLNEGVISFQLQWQKSFNQGLIYVASIRVKTLEGTHLIGKYSSSTIRVNSSAKKCDNIRT